jgi:hypothetical protein
MCQSRWLDPVQPPRLHAVAKRHGWSVVQVFEDAGISGANGSQRPAGA